MEAVAGQKDSQKSWSNLPVLIRAYLFGMLPSLLLLPITGTVPAMQMWLTVSVGIFLYYKAIEFSGQGQWVKVIAYLFIPGSLWLLFCVGGLIALAFPDNVTDFGVQTEPVAILLFSSYTLIGSLAYILAVTLLMWGKRLNSGFEMSNKRPRILLMTFGTLLFDWYVRFDQARQGLYFTWLRRFSDVDQLAYGTNLVYHIQSSVENLLIPLLLYLEAKTGSRLFRILLSMQMALIFLTGKRESIVLAIFTYFVAQAIIRHEAINRKLVLKGALVLFLFLVILGPAVQVARFQMRLSGRTLQENPAAVPIVFVTEYLPQAFTPSTYISTKQRASTIGRLGSYAQYGASVNQVLLNGDASPNSASFWNAFSVIVPRAFYPNKPIVDADQIVIRHFGLSSRVTDATGTPVVDIFSYLHVSGIVLLMIVIGLGCGLVIRSLIKYGTFGELMILGLLLGLLPEGDAFGAYLAVMRNALLVTIVTLFIFFGATREVKSAVV